MASDESQSEEYGPDNQLSSGRRDRETDLSSDPEGKVQPHKRLRSGGEKQSTITTTPNRFYGKTRKTNTPKTAKSSTSRFSTATVARFTPTVSRSNPTVSPTVSRFIPTVSRSTPTVSRSTPTVSRSTPTVSRSPPTVSRSPPTVSRSSPTVSRSSPTLPISARCTPKSFSRSREHSPSEETSEVDLNRDPEDCNRDVEENLNRDLVAEEDITRDEVVTALQSINSILRVLSGRVAGTETELKKMKRIISDQSISSSSESSTSKEKIPIIVRSETRKVYRTLTEDSEDYAGFDLTPGGRYIVLEGRGVSDRMTFKDSANKNAVATLIKEVQSINPSFQACHIRGAAYTYYRTLMQEQSLQQRGKLGDRNKVRRRRERLIRKLQDRLAAFKKSGYEKEDSRKWKKVLVSDLISSEESGEDDDTIIVKPLPWRSRRIDEFFHSLDNMTKEERSSQSSRQMKRRILGLESTRSLPDADTVPSWALQ